MRLGRLGRRAFAEFVFEQRRRQSGADQVLAEAVVNFLRQPRLLAVADLDNLFFKLSSLRDVLGDAGPPVSLPFLITHRKRTVADPADGSVRPDDPIFL